MTILLDSSVMIDALRFRRGRHEWLTSLIEQGHQLACCAINVAEVYSGMRYNEAGITAAFIGSLAYLDIEREAARKAGELRLEWQRKGRTLSLPDAMIGAVALSGGFVLATDNIKHFPMPDLKLLTLPTH
jgi:predicted nucleic acid-binding protein